MSTQPARQLILSVMPSKLCPACGGELDELMFIQASGTESCEIRWACCASCQSYRERRDPNSSGGEPRWEVRSDPPEWVRDPDYMWRVAEAQAAAANSRRPRA